MFSRLLALFILIPLIEIIILIKVGEWIGFGPTVALVVITGVIGATLARQQGFKVWTRIRRELNAGRMPATEVIDGLLILIGGIVLLTPGILTDLCGFSLMIPGVRRSIKVFVEKRLRSQHAKRPASTPFPKDDVIDI